MTATHKQIDYIESLLERKGYGTSIVTARHADLDPATVHQRGMTVRAWLESLSKADASHIIDALLEEE